MTQCRTTTIPKAGKIMGISRGLAYKLATSGELPTIRMGNRLLVSLVALERLLERGSNWSLAEEPGKGEGPSHGSVK